MSSAELRAASARVARAVYHGNPDEEADARRALAVVKIETYIERTLAAAPPLKPEQIKVLRGLLRTGGDAR